jgi:simple sugar transport system ATP-binding protein
MGEQLLELRNISKEYAGVRALDGVDFNLSKGEIHGLVGENGSGKSTLIKIISGVETPEPGAEIIIEGRRFSHLSSKVSTDLGIRVIYQDLSLFPTLTVAENIAFNVHLEEGGRLVRWRRIRDTAERVIGEVGISLDLERIVGTLSIADQQLVAICRALVGRTILLILDEPTSSLTKNEVDALASVIADLQKKGISILFISHKLNEIFQIAENVTVLRDGKKVGVFGRGELNHESLAFHMTGKTITYTKLEAGPPRAAESGDHLLEVRKLSKRGNFRDVSFSLDKGEILGITGLLGSGRTELALALFGMNPAESGRVLIEGKSISIRTNKDAVSLGIGYVPENRIAQGLVMPQSIGNNIVITALERLLNRFDLIDEQKRGSAVRKWVEELAIKVPATESAVMTLSGGNQQRVVLAKWIATDPRILILDEPTVGIDVAAKSSIHHLIKLLTLRGIGIIMISDEVHEVLYNCHRILIMRRGRIVEEISPTDVTEDELAQKVNEG